MTESLSESRSNRTKIDPRESWTTSFSTFLDQRADEPEWLTERRREGLDRFHALGFPTKRDERWKYTDVAPLARSFFKQARAESVTAVSEEALGRYTFWDESAARLVFVNGLYAPHLSRRRDLPDGVRVMPLSDALGDDEAAKIVASHLGRHASHENHAFRALNTAYFTDGAFIQVPRGVVVERPIHVLFVNAPCVEPVASHPRVLVHAAESAQATVIEQYGALGGHDTFTNPVTEVVLEANAQVAHDLIQRENESTWHVGTVLAEQARDSVFRSCVVTVGGRLVRNDTDAVHGGTGCETHLDGLYITRGRQHVDNHTIVDHAFPHGQSHELYKGIMTDRSTGVFNGKVVVREGAKGTDAHQNNRNLLLSDDADIDTKPELEIYHHDVKCSHGATIGQLDADAMFYLRSRGLPKHEAKRLLTFAFASDVVDRVRIPAIRDRLREFLAQRMSWSTAAEDDASTTTSGDES